MAEYNLEEFHLMNKSLFDVTIEGDHYLVEDLIRGISNLRDRLIFLEEPPSDENLFRVFCTNNSDTYEKLYLDELGNITLSVVSKLIK